MSRSGSSKGTASRSKGYGHPAAPAQRSKVTNGSRVLANADGNSVWTRRYKDLIAGHASDLGGYDHLSEAQVSLIRRVAAMEIELEEMEGRLSQGVVVDLDLYTRTAGHLRRYLETLGVEHVPPPAPTIEEYIAQKRAERAAAAEDAEVVE
jgi:hypothetical protein